MTLDDSGRMYFSDYEKQAYFSFAAYEDHRVKAFKYFAEDSLLVTVSTEGFVTVWSIDFIVDKLKDITGDIDLTEKVEPLYTFNMESRLISLDCRVERKKQRNAPEEDAVKIRSRTLDNKRSFIDQITKGSKRVTRISALGGRRGAQHLNRMRKFSMVNKLIRANQLVN